MSKWFAVIILAVTLIFNQVAQKSAAEITEEYFRQMIPEAASFKKIDDKVAKAVDKDGEIIAYAGIDKSMGYGGPVLVGTTIAPDGSITGVVVLQHKETSSYIQDMVDSGYFQQYQDKSVIDPLELDSDIDGVSGATLSSRAIGKSVQSVARIVAMKELKIASPGTAMSWKVGIPELAIAFIFAAALFLIRQQSLIKYRLLLLGFSAVIMGFWLNRPLTIAHIAGLFQGYFPDINSNLIWYIVVIGAVVPPLVTGKNIYCTWICPFCALQEATHLISRKSLPIGENIIVLRRFRDFILFLVLFLAFLFQNPSIPSFEPFGTVFSFKGSSFSWYLLAVVLLSSFFFRRFWCIAFCPVGNFLDKTSAIGRTIRKRLISDLAHRHTRENGSLLENKITFQDLSKESESKVSAMQSNGTGWSRRLLVTFYLAIIMGAMLVVFDKWWTMTP